MSKILDLNKPVFELAKEYPDFIEIFAGLGFKDIKNPVMLNSMGRFITINKGAEMKGIPLEKIKEVLKSVDGVVEAVNFNEPNQTVIAGEKEAVEKACVVLKEAGAKRAMPLAVSGPFHSSLMKEAGEQLKEEAKNYTFNIGKTKIVANTTAELLESDSEVKDEIYRQSFGPVKWVDTINKLKELGVTKIYEIGPGKVLSGLIKKIDKEIEVENIELI